ncbi:MAG: hypothetical protein FGM57_01985 [Candidatus Taylorbacteria bacterium]|nr:hypothetical protein [Candidatus Taylorbacteria bacterium]
MFKRTITLFALAIAAGAAGYTYGYNIGFDTAHTQGLKTPSAKITEKKPIETGPNLSNMLRAVTGNWQSVADKKLVREFTASSTVTDRYANKKIFSGSLTLFNIQSDEKVSFTMQPGRSYMKIIDDKATVTDENGTTTEGVTYYQIDTVTPTELKITSIGTEGEKSISFKRI